MRPRVVNSLNERDRLLVLETDRASMERLDEEALIDLHGRVRRARAKYVQLYRREASAKVTDSRGRGTAYGRSERNREVAEVFEGALARVSRRLAVAAAAAERELRAERIAAARAGSTGPAIPAEGSKGAATAAGRRAPHEKTTGALKRDASSRAAGARRQAKRDAR